MSKPAIRVEKLSKLYKIGARRAIQRSFRETITDAAASRFRRLFSGNGRSLPQSPAGSIHDNGSTSTIWALKDVSFEVQPGEVVGIIGRNGAGKSTLLKILSRITEPTKGYADIYGRVGSLLEVGTGFHAELTGRENTYLNGAILGMRRAEITRKFDAIVAFAEVERFIDTPVKHYSSGMYMRLAFAVAAHLEPEILLVDEVLAVGDVEFQNKCLGKMNDVARGGRTILFVSHNMAAIQSLCHKTFLFKNGQLSGVGRTSDLIAAYMSEVPCTEFPLRNHTDRQGSQLVRIARVTLLPSSGRPTDSVAAGDEVVIVIEYDNLLGAPICNIEVAIGIYDMLGHQVTFLESPALNRRLSAQGTGGFFGCRMGKLPFAPGEYFMDIHIKENANLLDWIHQACRFTVYAGDFFGTGKLPYSRPGSIFVDHSWEN